MPSWHFVKSYPFGGIHALARVAEIGSSYWQPVSEMASDKDELVRVGALRAVGRMAEPGWGKGLF